MNNIIINFSAVVGGAIFLFIMGMLWYGPIFGKVWMKIMGVENMSKEEIAKAQKEMMPMYITQVLLGFVTSYVLYIFVKMSGLGIMMGFWVWLGFAMPMAAGAMWDTKKGMAMKKFLIVAGYQLVTLLVLGWAFTMW
jgi:hypothetical protein